MIHTHDSEESRGYSECLCSICGSTGICTPQHDYFSEVKGGPLICEPCFMKKHFGKQVKVLWHGTNPNN